MKGDFSRWSFDRKKNFNGVLHQQGRVLLDHDWNAQTRIAIDWQDQAGRDAIGPGVAAVPATEPDSLKVKSAEAVPVADLQKVKLTITPGRIWADGLLTHLPGEDPDPKADVLRTATYLQPPIQDPPGNESEITDGIRDAVILEVWQEAINGFQMPETLIEPALGGPDTTERVHTAMAFRLLRLADEDTCHNIGDKLKDDFSNKGKLKVTLQPTTEIDGECPVVEGGGYTGFEHHLYRVEIAQVDSGVPMFKWSQFNGGLVGRGDCDLGGPNKKITITANDQAIKMSGLNNFYLEVVELDPDQGYWRITYGAEVTLNGDDLEVATEHYTEAERPSGRVFFRLWNGIRAISDFPQNPPDPESNELRDGIRLEFKDPSTVSYVSGDYWTFKVRAGEINNPEVLINHEPPQGIHYHRVPLAILNWNSEKDISFEDEEIQDCRRIFRPLTNQTVCCTFTVGDGKSSHGHFDSIEEAVRHLPGSGGEICLLPGLHEANVVIEGKRNIKIRGCDKKTKVIPRESNREAPMFCVKDSQCITLENIDLATLGGVAIDLEGTELGKLQEVEIRTNRILACKNAIRVVRGVGINIHHNKIRMLDKEEGDVAIYMMAEDSVIERNSIFVIPAKTIRPESVIPDFRLDPTDPCVESETIYRHPRFFVGYANLMWNVATVLLLRKRFKAPGGIQIASESERVKVLENQINGGSWNGITLGHLPSELSDPLSEIKKKYGLYDLPAARLKIFQEKFKSFLYDLAIEGNAIKNMGLNGIGVVGFFGLQKIGLMVSVNDLTIYRNHIENCLQQIPEETPKRMRMEMGFGGISLSDCENLIIRENCIENNGTSHFEPVSGIYILHGEKIDISDNRILNNGPRTSGNNDDARPGMRGGIVIGLSFAKVVRELFEDKEFFYQDGIPAVKIHDNIVTQPLGHALFIMAFGPVSVVGNHLTSQGADFKVNPLSLLAGTVIILNLGVSKDLPTRLLLSSIKDIARSTYPTMRVSPEKDSPFSLLYLPNGNVLFANNQTTLDLRAPEVNFALSSQLIFSLDDVSYVGNQSECTSLRDIVLSNSVILAITIRTNDNRFQEGITRTFFSLISYGLMNTCATNQATHCLLALGHPSLRVYANNKVLHNSNCDVFLELLQRHLMIADHKKSEEG